MQLATLPKTHKRCNINPIETDAVSTDTLMIALTTAAVKRGAELAMKVLHCFSNNINFFKA